MNEGLLATGFPYRDSGKRKNLDYFRSFLTGARAVRRLGVASIDLCYTACGIFDGFWEFGLGSWDIAAGVVLVEEAGGKVTNFSGRPVELPCGEILASNGLLHGAMMRRLRRAM